MCEKYAGYTNHETWLVVTHGVIDDPYWETEVIPWIKRDSEDRTKNPWMDPRRYLIRELADQLKDATDEFICEAFAYKGTRNQCSLASDLVNSAFSVINWTELAEHILETYEENLEEETNE